MKKRVLIIELCICSFVLVIMIGKLYPSKSNFEALNETSTTIPDTTLETTVKTTKKVVKTTKKTIVKNTTTHKETQNGYKLTHYGWNCKGCSGNTAIGYNVRHTIYYNDSQFGKVRICAMSKSMPLYSVIKIKNYKLGGDITCIVIDRGVGSGVIDLLTESEQKSSQLGIQKGVQIEILRKGRG